MLLPVLSRRCQLLRSLRSVRALTDSADGNRAPLSRCCCGGLPALSWRSFSVQKRACPQWYVLGLFSRCLSSSVPSSGGPSSPGELIYTGSLATAVRGVKAFSYSTSGASFLLMPHILLNTGLANSSWALQVVFCGVISFFTFLTPVLLHLITKGYVVRLYHEPQQDTYTAVTYSVLLTEKRTTFHQKQVRVPDVSKMFTTFYADRTGLLVNPDLFTVPQEYNHLMGYDKPFSFCPEQLDKS